MIKDNKGLFDKKRFEWLEEEKIRRLQKLTMEETIKMTEYLFSSNLFSELKDNFLPDSPLCLKLGLRTRGKNVRRRI
ncbi:MAG: hypothetical protein AB1393_12515 [Candidatus Edwardsbacteria bacterium]